jgi:hypothetical protein
LVIENPQKMQLIQYDNYTNQVNNGEYFNSNIFFIVNHLVHSIDTCDCLHCLTSLYILETILSTFGDSSRQVKPQLRFGKTFISFVILAFTLCILLGEPGCSIPFAKLIRSDDAFVRRIIIFIFMILLNAAYMINCSFINLNDENVNFGWPIISFFTMQVVGFLICTGYGCLCGATYVIG